jgi:putative LysE/RhtB family amino acid efflux pump
VLAGFGLGLLLAAQVGPVTLLVVRSILRGGRALVVGLAMAVAIAGIDVLYATLGLVGAGKLTNGADVRLVLGLASAAILCAIGLRTMWNGLRARMGLESAADVVSARRAFATAIAATALNPLTIALWTVSFPAAAPNAAQSTVGNGAALLVGVAAGTLLWYSGFSTVVAVGRRFLGPRLLPAFEVATGGGLVLFGGLLGLRAVEDR